MKEYRMKLAKSILFMLIVIITIIVFQWASDLIPEFIVTHESDIVLEISRLLLLVIMLFTLRVLIKRGEDIKVRSTIKIDLLGVGCGLIIGSLFIITRGLILQGCAIEYTQFIENIIKSLKRIITIAYLILLIVPFSLNDSDKKAYKYTVWTIIAISLLYPYIFRILNFGVNQNVLLGLVENFLLSIIVSYFVIKTKTGVSSIVAYTIAINIPFVLCIL